MVLRMMSSILARLARAVLVSLIAGAGVVRAQEAPERFAGYRSGFHRDILELQVLLDRKHLSCNCVDGIWGARTEIALQTWQLLNGLPVTGIPDAAVHEALGGGPPVLTRYTVTEEDTAALGPFPDDWDERSKLPALRYVTLQEMLAEKGHLSQRALQRLNPDAAWPNPPAGTEIVLPDCSHEKLQRAGSIRITLGRTEIAVYNTDGDLIALFPCSIARDKSHRPDGVLTVRTVAPNPNYTYDPQLFAPGGENTVKLIIPPGPNNPVGLAWIGLSLQGYGIHGTPIPENIGRAESKGCFRLANWNAVKLLQMVEAGTPILVEE